MVATCFVVMRCLVPRKYFWACRAPVVGNILALVAFLAMSVHAGCTGWRFAASIWEASFRLCLLLWATSSPPSVLPVGRLLNFDVARSPIVVRLQKNEASVLRSELEANYN